MAEVDDPIAEGVPLEKAFVKDLLAKAFKDVPEIAAVRRIDEGQGYASVIVVLELDWNREPKSVVLKVPTLSKLMKVMENLEDKSMAEQFTTDMQDKLQIMVTKLENNAYRLFDGDNLPVKIRTPKLYLAGDVDDPSKGGLIIEDLTSVAKTNPDLANGLTLPQLRSVTRHIAELHAFSLKTTRWREVLETNPFLDLLATSHQHFEGSFKMMDKLRNEFPDISSLTLEQCGPFMHSEFYTKMFDNDLVPANMRVIVHGDFWMNNLLFSDDGKGDELLAVIDWQGCHIGPPGMDFGRLLGSSVDPSIRRNELANLVSEYYKHLTELMGKQEIPFTEKDVLHSAERSFCGQTAMMAVMPAFLLGPQGPCANLKGADRRTLAERGFKNAEDALKMINEKKYMDN